MHLAGCLKPSCPIHCNSNFLQRADGSTAFHCKMADIDVRIRQLSVIEFLTAEGEMPIRLHERLKNVYGDATVDVSTVRLWVRRCKEAEEQTRRKSPCVNGLGDKTLLFTGLEYMPLLKGGQKRWKWTEIILK